MFLDPLGMHGCQLGTAREQSGGVQMSFQGADLKTEDIHGLPGRFHALQAGKLF